MQISSDDPLAWRGIPAPSLAEIEALAADAYARLPEHFRGFATISLFRSPISRPRKSSTSCTPRQNSMLLGLFQGVGLPFQSASVPEQLPNMVWLYRRPILDYWAEHEESLGAIVTHVLVHEIGHHFGDCRTRTWKRSRRASIERRRPCDWTAAATAVTSASKPKAIRPNVVDLPLYRIARPALARPSRQHPHARQVASNS